MLTYKTFNEALVPGATLKLVKIAVADGVLARIKPMLIAEGKDPTKIPEIGKELIVVYRNGDKMLVTDTDGKGGASVSGITPMGVPEESILEFISESRFRMYPTTGIASGSKDSYMEFELTAPEPYDEDGVGELDEEGKAAVQSRLIELLAQAIGRRPEARPPGATLQ